MLLMPSVFRNNLFDDFFDDFPAPARRMPAPQSSLMKTDIRETEGSYELDMDMPGYKKEDVKAQLKDGYLTVSASTSNTNEEKDGEKFLRRERFYGSCSRSFYVGDAVKEEDIKAKFEDGILKISVPKKQLQPQVEQPKYIAIEG